MFRQGEQMFRQGEQERSVERRQTVRYVGKPCRSGKDGTGVLISDACRANFLSMRGAIFVLLVTVARGAVMCKDLQEGEGVFLQVSALRGLDLSVGIGSGRDRVGGAGASG